LPTTVFLQLKLKSGYNIGIDYSSIKEISVVSKPETGTQDKNKEEKVEGKRIVLLHTGGTIASKVDYATGAVYPSISSSELLENYSELKEMANVETIVVSNLLSENLRFEDINRMAEALQIQLEDENVLGVIITHGTDTMHYTAAALSFMIPKITKPIIITGSQRSSDRPSSDAKINLLNSVYSILNIPKSELDNDIYLCLHHSIYEENCCLIRGLNARKNHSSRRDAFESINRPKAAVVDYSSDSFEISKEYLQYQEIDRKAKSENNFGKENLFLLDENKKVGILKAHPNLFPEEVEMYSSFDGLIIEGTGFGHLPVIGKKESEKVLESLKKLASKIPVFMTKQPIWGMTNLKIYAAGRRIGEAGVLGDEKDITTESAFMKLAWPVSNANSEEAKKLMETNLRGEFNIFRNE
jgi:glutamyl-tRNA(Gln) amidotransferase subunit D